MCSIRKQLKDQGQTLRIMSTPEVAMEECLDCIKSHFNCSICCDVLNKPIQTQCGHVFCGVCLKKICTEPNPSCPLCKTRISNRSLITRDDIEDMKNLVDNLNKVFKTELGRFLNSKDKTANVTVMAKRKRSSSSGKSPGKMDVTKKAEEKDKLNENENIVKDKHGKKDSLGKSVLLKESLDELAKRKSLDEQFILAERNKTLNKNPEQETKPRDQQNDEPIKIKDTSVGQELEPVKMTNRNLKYAIMTADVIPIQALDLSLSSRRKSPQIKYKFHTTTAIKFIKPLDLSMKNKRKMEEVEIIDLSDTNDKTPQEKSVPQPAHQGKKRKFVEDLKMTGEKEPSCSLKLTEKGAKKRTSQKLSDFAIDCENMDDEDESLIQDDPPVFTPTPPDPPKNVSPNAGIAQTNNDIASDIMRDFDLPFDDDNGDDISAHASSGGGRRITNSDEVLGNLPVESLVYSKDVCLTKLQPPPQKGQVDSTKNKDHSFVFKQPAKSISQQSHKKKSKDEYKSKNYIENMDIDDDFQQPRDSDLMFLDISMSGGVGGPDGKRLKTTDSDGNMERVNRRGSGFGSHGEKENGVIARSSFRVSKRTASPVKPAKPSTSESNLINYEPKKKIQKQKKDDDVMFEDEEDEDWLLDIPETSNGKRNSGRSKQGPNQAATLVEKIIPAKQRYVFCPTRLSKAQTIKLQQLCKMCNGTITKDFTDDVTHLVINLTNGRVPQTLKYLLAIAGRKWVVIFDWIEKCVDSGEVVSEAPYETSNFKQCDPGVKRSRLAEKNLFEGYKFFFATEIYTSLGFAKNEVKALLSTLGATVVDSAENRYKDLIVIGSLNGDSTKYNDWLNTRKWITVTFDWVIECILEYRLKPFEPKYLCVDVSKIKSISAPKAFQVAFTQYLTQRSQMMSPSC